jgi:hypothetical protein
MSRVSTRLLGATAALFCLALTGVPRPAVATDTAEDNSAYVRFNKLSSNTAKLETAIVSFRSSAGVAVDLVGAVHVGDAAYYHDLNKRFRTYDAVLYELVADESRRAEPTAPSAHPIGMMQQGMKSMLGLAFQLDEIDYDRPNFVHADVTPEQFEAMQAERGETLFETLLRGSFAEQRRRATEGANPLESFQMLYALMQDDGGHALKFVLGQQFDQLDGALSGLDAGPNGQGSALLSGRNEVAIKVLREQLAKRKRRIAIFYGAGHMPDLEKRLEKLGFRRQKKAWLTAWDIRPTKK